MKSAEEVERLNRIAERVLECFHGNEDTFDGYDMFTVVEIVAPLAIAWLEEHKDKK